MKTRVRATADSLELFLDIICNVFGGIVLLAILVALLARDVRVVDETDRTKRLSFEMLERKLAIATQDLKQAEQDNAAIKAKLDDPERGERVALGEARQTLQGEIATLSATAAALDDSIKLFQHLNTQFPAEQLESLKERLKVLERQRIEEQNNIVAASQNIDRLQKRIADLDDQTQRERQKQVVQLRLPKESLPTSRPFYVIIRYGQIYFTRDPTQPGMPRNTAALTWEGEPLLLFSNVEIKPIRGKGLDQVMSAATIANYLRRIRRDDFFIFCFVYNDSFAAFNEFKKTIFQWGLEFGWEPCTADSRIRETTDAVFHPKQ